MLLVMAEPLMIGWYLGSGVIALIGSLKVSLWECPRCRRNSLWALVPWDRSRCRQRGLDFGSSGKRRR